MAAERSMLRLQVATELQLFLAARRRGTAFEVTHDGTSSLGPSPETVPQAHADRERDAWREVGLDADRGDVLGFSGEYGLPTNISPYSSFFGSGGGNPRSEPPFSGSSDTRR